MPSAHLPMGALAYSLSQPYIPSVIPVIVPFHLPEVTSQFLWSYPFSVSRHISSILNCFSQLESPWQPWPWHAGQIPDRDVWWAEPSQWEILYFELPGFPSSHPGHLRVHRWDHLSSPPLHWATPERGRDHAGLICDCIPVAQKHLHTRVPSQCERSE